LAQQVDDSGKVGNMNGWLEDYFDSVTTGPGLWRWRHYFPIYERHFAKFRGQEVNVLEIGIFAGGGLRMWEQYFGPRAHIYGVDLRPECKVHENAQTKVFVGDQTNRKLWDEFTEQVPRLDVIVDDGGHSRACCVAAFEALFPHLNPGGVYLCEDLYVSEEESPGHGFQEYLNGPMTRLHDWLPTDICEDPTAPPEQQAWWMDTNDWQRNIDSIRIYPFVAVIEMRDQPLERIVCPMHGTEWPPLPEQVLPVSPRQ
jgi:hypothetical protein